MQSTSRIVGILTISLFIRFLQYSQKCHQLILLVRLSLKSLRMAQSLPLWTSLRVGTMQTSCARFEQLADRFPNANFLKVDVDEQRGIASEHEVKAMPTFQFFLNGKKVEEVVGADIVKVERLVASLAKGGAASFPASGGRVLGSGAAPTSGSGGLGTRSRTWATLHRCSSNT
ncbi:hypothetical protein BC829DRAFT_3202 [Chytridium lagenaria]|nr:hypothetical protein BC829DRAFT_3202 [Chytridium lagenaria]